MTYRLRLPGAVYRAARDRAGDDTALHDILLRYVTAYASGQTAQQRAGSTTASRATPEQRSARARAAVTARWDAHRARTQP